jgi:hypothetical protein
MGSERVRNFFGCRFFIATLSGAINAECPTQARRKSDHIERKRAGLPPEVADALEELVGAVKAVESRLSKLEDKGHAAPTAQMDLPMEAEPPTQTGPLISCGLSFETWGVSGVSSNLSTSCRFSSLISSM